MKKYTIILMVALFALASCEKEQISNDELALKKKPASSNTNNGGNGGGGGNTFFIVPNQDNLTIHVGETYQLAVAPVAYVWPDISWYTNDQGICQSYWDGHIQGNSVGVTVISAFHYQATGQPLQDNIIVNVIQ